MLATTGTLLKVHVHTNHPDEVAMRRVRDPGLHVDEEALGGADAPSADVDVLGHQIEAFNFEEASETLARIAETLSIEV